MPSTALNHLKEKAMCRAGHSTKKKDFSLADFISEEAIEDLHLENLQQSLRRKSFDSVDGFCAEIVGRFGYEVYDKWNRGEITDQKIRAWLDAERAREAAQLVHLETTIISGISATVRRYKGEKKPKGIDRAQKLIRALTKTMNGERN